MNDKQKDEIRKQVLEALQESFSCLKWSAHNCLLEEPTEEEQKVYRAYAGFDYEPNDDTFLIRGALSVNYPHCKLENTLIAAAYMSYADCDSDMHAALVATKHSMRESIGYALIA